MFEWHGFGGGMMWLFWILILAVLLWLVVITTRRGSSSHRDEKSARNLLNKRYARGEIDRDEYEQKKGDLDD